MLQVAELSGVHMHLTSEANRKSQWGNSQILLDNIEAAERGSQLHVINIHTKLQLGCSSCARMGSRWW